MTDKYAKLREAADHPGKKAIKRMQRISEASGIQTIWPLEATDVLDALAAEKARADAAEAAYRIEHDQVVAALRAIESMCPATQEMTLAHAMADLARDTLTDIGAE